MLKFFIWALSSGDTFHSMKGTATSVWKLAVTYLEFFLGRPLHTLHPQRQHHHWCQVEKFSKFLPTDTLKMHSQALTVLQFLCETFSKLLKLTLRKTLFQGWFLTNSYIQRKKLYGYKLVRAVRQYSLKDAASST